MTEVWRPKGEEAQIYKNKQTISRIIREETGNALKTVRQKSAETAIAVFFAAGSVGLIGCKVEFQSPIVFKSPTSTPAPTSTPTASYPPTEIPRSYPELRPTSIPRPTPTAKPTSTPIPTSTPRPIPTLKPTPTERPTPTPTPPPTPEAPKTYVKPGRQLANSYPTIDNPSSTSKKRLADVEFQGGNEQNSVKIQIKVSKTQQEIEIEREIARKKAIKEGKDPNKIVIDTEKSISEGTVFDVLPGVTTFHIIVDVPPGADPGCFNDIIFSLKTAEPGTSGGEIERVSLAKNVCVEETLTTYFSGLRYDEDTKRVVGDMVLINSAPVGQMAELVITNCSFTVAEKEAERRVENVLERLDLNKSIPFPPNSRRTYNVYLKPTGKNPSDPSCTVTPKRDFDRQIPEPTPIPTQRPTRTPVPTKTPTPTPTPTKKPEPTPPKPTPPVKNS